MHRKRKKRPSVRRQLRVRRKIQLMTPAMRTWKDSAVKIPQRMWLNMRKKCLQMTHLPVWVQIQEILDIQGIVAHSRRTNTAM